MIASFPYRAPDSTQLLNFITKDILPMGVYAYPELFIVPGVSPFQVTVKTGWVLRNHDGMTIREEDVDNTVVVNAVADHYVGLESQYILSPEPAMELKAILVSDYVAYTQAQKDAFVIFAKVTPQSGGVITTSNIDVDNFITRPRGTLALQEDLQIMSQSVVRAVSTNAGLSALSSPVENEVAYVSNEKSLYIYSSGAWSVIDRPLAGSGTFAGSSSFRTITPSYLPTSYGVSITPTADSAGHLGNYWVNTFSDRFQVYNDGDWSGAGATFDWVIFSK